jgi:hypothetical protein
MSIYTLLQSIAIGFHLIGAQMLINSVLASDALLNLIDSWVSEGQGPSPVHSTGQKPP